jgi:hypothetical protein
MSGFVARLKGGAEIGSDGSIHCRWCQVLAE